MTELLNHAKTWRVASAHAFHEQLVKRKLGALSRIPTTNLGRWFKFTAHGCPTPEEWFLERLARGCNFVKSGRQAILPKDSELADRIKRLLEGIRTAGVGMNLRCIRSLIVSLFDACGETDLLSPHLYDPR